MRGVTSISTAGGRITVSLSYEDLASLIESRKALEIMSDLLLGYQDNAAKLLAKKFKGGNEQNDAVRD